MELGKQIKSYRDRDGLSQEKLAEKIYVSRQSISNWENEKSYPDIHNLLQLSEVFQVSLDELIKGDVDMMRKEVERNVKTKVEGKEMYFWGKGMLIGLGGMILSIGPALLLPGLTGLIIPAAFFLVGMVSTVQAERLKRRYSIKTYQDILNYMEGKEPVVEKTYDNERWLMVRDILFILGCAAGGFFGVIAIIKVFFR